MRRARTDAALESENLLSAVVARRGRDVKRPAAIEQLMRDPTFRRELSQLRAAEQHFRTRGIDIRQCITFDVTHPFLREWQDQSDDVAESMPGRSDLRRLRRRGILRFLDGEELAMPLDPPPIVALPPTPWRNAEWRTLRLRDEADYLEMIFVPSTHPMVRMRPVVDVISHRQARAILDWPSSRLDYWISAAPHLLGGLRQIEITPAVRDTLNARAEAAGQPIAKPRRTLHRVSFQTMEFMIWLTANQN